MSVIRKIRDERDGKVSVNVASKLSVFVISQNGKNKYDVNNTYIHLFSIVRPVEG